MNGQSNTLAEEQRKALGLYPDPGMTDRDRLAEKLFSEYASYAESDDEGLVSMAKTAINRSNIFFDTLEANNNSKGVIK